MEGFQQQHKRGKRKGKSYYQGNGQVRKGIDDFKVPSDSSSCSSNSKEEDSFVFESRWHSLKQAGGTPMKKLLAEELSKEMEVRRRPPSVIARLMGLDPLPPSQPIHKQQKKLPENYLQRTSSIRFQEKSSSYESCSSRMSIKEQKEFKDVFEVLETSKAEKHNSPSIHKVADNSKPSEVKMEFVRQKFMDAKRLSTDEKLQHSKEFHDALEVLDSNSDLLLKFLQEPDSLFTKHLRSLHGVPPPLQSGHITVLKSSKAPKYEDNEICWKSTRKTERRDDLHSHQKFGNGLISHSPTEHAHNSYKFSKSQFEEKNEICHLPTRIVVLKPNLLKRPETAGSVSSPSSSAGFKSSYRKHREYQSFESGELYGEILEQKNSSNEMDRLRQRSGSSREIAKEITRQMMHSVSNSSEKASCSGFRGYAGDESSCSMSVNDSADESEVVAPTSSYLSDWRNRYSPSTSYTTESSVSREAKKRLSERWKMIHRFQEVGLAGRGSTLGEMLAKSDREMRPITSDSVIDQDGFGDRLPRNDGVTRWGSPLGISSKDGWKDGCAKNLPRSRSLPASFTAFGSPESSIRHKASPESSIRHRASPESSFREPNNSRKGNSNHIEISFHKNLRFKGKKSQSSLCVDEKHNHTVYGTYLSLDELRDNLEGKDLPAQKPITPELLVGGHAYAKLVADQVIVVEPEDVSTPSVSPAERQPEPTSCHIRDSFTNDPEDSLPEEKTIGPPEEGVLCSQCAVPEPESSSQAEEADQPSPVSVLEPPFVDEISSDSESFERVGADLQGLRMQLELLKLESSEAYLEPDIIVSSDEDSGETSIGLPEERREFLGIYRAEESRDFSYVVDVLVDSRFHGPYREMVLTKWCSPECPVDPVVFEKLEKKYIDHMCWPRSDRRLLFDCINLGLMEISRSCMDPHPWVKTMMKKVGHGRCEDVLEEELWKVLVSQGKEGSKDSLAITLDREMWWLELGDDIDAVGREIERSLMDELVAEVVSI